MYKADADADYYAAADAVHSCFQEICEQMGVSWVGWGHNAVRLVEGCYLQAEGTARPPQVH